MLSNTDTPEVIRISQKGQTTIPKSLREKFGIETPREVFIYENEGRIIIEPVPSLEDLHGIHAGDRDSGETLRKVDKLRDREYRREITRAEGSRPDE
jgi:looped-hinge helix DNA binding domain, AbrB family